MSGEISFQSYEIDRAPFIYLDGIGPRHSLKRPGQHVIQLVLGQTVLQARSINETECRGKGTVEPHFLSEAAVRRGNQIFTRTRVPAAGVGPSSGRVVFAWGPSLKENAAVRVLDEYRE